MSNITEQEERWHSVEAFVAACTAAGKITEATGGMNATIDEINTFQELLKKQGFSVLPIKAALQNKVSDVSSEEDWIKVYSDLLIEKQDFSKAIIGLVKQVKLSIVNERKDKEGVRLKNFNKVIDNTAPEIKKEVVKMLDDMDKENERKDNVGVWVDVNNELPKEGGRYWCYLEEQTSLGLSHFQWNCSYHEIEKRFSDQHLKNGEKVTHWMPLPTPPKKTSK
jgi:hypothetical protein